MKDKTKQIWYRYGQDRDALKRDCVDLLSKCYMMLGQRPDAAQIVLMAKFLYEDLAKYYGSLEMDEINFIFEQGIKHSENGGFVNVRNWNIWLKEYKKKSNLQRQQNQLTDWQKELENQKLIGLTIKEAKKLK